MGHRVIWLGGARGLEQYAMPDGVCGVSALRASSHPVYYI